MKILFVLEYFYPHIGGAEKVFYSQALELAKKNTVTVVTTHLKGTKEREKINGINIIRVRTPNWAQRYWFMLLALPTLFKTANKYDLIHTTTYNAALTSWFAAKLLNIRIVITILEVIGKRWFNLGESNKVLQYGYYFYEKFIINLPYDRYIAISEATKKDLLANTKIDKENVIVSYPILDTERWDRRKYKKNTIRKQLNLENNQFIYLYFGRSGISKGPEFLIKAVPQISRIIKNSRLLMILSEHPRSRYEYLKNLAEKLGNDSIILIPPVPNDEIPLYISSADCVVVPSLTEGYGYSALEASLLKVPLVASKVGSLPEVLPDDTFFVKPRNPKEIAEAVCKIFKTKPEIKSKPKPLSSPFYGTEVESLYDGLF